MTDTDEQRRRKRSLLLFAVHVGLALAVLAGFVWSVTHK